VTNLFFVSNTNTVIIDELQQSGSSAYVNDATVTCTVKDADGVAVTGETFPVSGSYVAASNGRYEINISSALNVAAGDAVTAEVTATSGSVTGFWTLPIKVRTRRN